MKKSIFLICAIIGIAGIVFFYLFRSSRSEELIYRTKPLKFGDLTSIISATGTVEPEDLIDVGAQVAGRIVSFGKDNDGKEIDYGSKVEEGAVLAKIDDVLYQTSVLEARAKLQEAKAYLIKTQADIGQLEAKNELASLNFIRAEKLQTSNANTKAEYDACKAELDSTKANLNVGKALVSQAQASVDIAKASLTRAEQNLDYCTIRSPVNGIVIDRRVNIGQTVVASLNAPSLFLIAKDLNRMEVWVSVNEADIGQIKESQRVTFTVDAYPDHIFDGKVSKIRMNASVNQNVVTYIVEVEAHNTNGKLIPYLTANVNFEIETKKNVFMVVNSALGWKPDQSQNVDAKQTQKSQIWVIEGKELKPIEITPGITDGSFTEIEGDGLKEGMEVIYGVKNFDETKSSASSPFVPQFKIKK